MFRAHVLIIRRSKLHYTASGIIKPTGGHLVHRLRESPLARGRIVAHEKEQRRATAAISPTIMFSGSANKYPSGVAELVRIISIKRTSL